jgi:DnaJ domain
MLRGLPPFDPYSELGIASNATQDEIESAYRTLVRQYHPDVASNRQAGLARTKRLNVAYEWLGNPRLRAAYDRQRTVSRPREGSRPPHDERRAAVVVASPLLAGLHPRRAFRPDPGQVDLNALGTRVMVATVVVYTTLGFAAGPPAAIVLAALLDVSLVALVLRLNGPATATSTWSAVGISAAAGSILGSVIALAGLWIIDRIAHGLLSDVSTMIATHAIAWGLLLGIPSAALGGALLAETRWSLARLIGQLMMSGALVTGAACIAYIVVMGEATVRP